MQPSHNRKVSESNPSTTFEKIEKLHPHKMLLYLAMFGSSLIFVFMLIAFTSTYNAPSGETSSFVMPKAFIFSTLVLLVSSYFVSRFERAYENEELKKLSGLMGVTILLGFIFTLSQYWGWHQLEQSGYSLQGLSSGAYLYVISGLHILHLVGGIFFMTYQFIKVSRVSRDAVRSLIMITNPYQKTKLEMLSAYWHFMDLLWVSMFLYFLFIF
jgi:cytochrome c oxidase subunit 3